MLLYTIILLINSSLYAMDLNDMQVWHLRDAIVFKNDLAYAQAHREHYHPAMLDEFLGKGNTISSPMVGFCLGLEAQNKKSCKQWKARCKDIRQRASDMAEAKEIFRFFAGGDYIAAFALCRAARKVKPFEKAQQQCEQSIIDHRAKQRQDTEQHLINFLETRNIKVSENPTEDEAAIITNLIKEYVKPLSKLTKAIKKLSNLPDIEQIQEIERIKVLIHDLNPKLVNLATNGGDILLPLVAWYCPQLVEDVLKKGANPDCIDSWGDTALYEIIKEQKKIWTEEQLSNPEVRNDLQRRLKAFELLLQHGANPNIKNKAQKIVWDEAFLFGAGLNNSYPYLRLLLKYRDSNAPIVSGKTPLLYFISQGRFDEGIIKLLLDAGADPDVADQQKAGYTPLHFAVIGQSLEVILLLLNACADPDKVCAYGISPYKLSCYIGLSSKYGHIWKIFLYLASASKEK